MLMLVVKLDVASWGISELWMWLELDEVGNGRENDREVESEDEEAEWRRMHGGA